MKSSDPEVLLAGSDFSFLPRGFVGPDASVGSGFCLCRANAELGRAPIPGSLPCLDHVWAKGEGPGTPVVATAVAPFQPTAF